MFEALLKKLASALHQHEIPYMIIGGQAVLLHGEPRLTRDIDITLGIDVDRLKDILSLIEDVDLRALVEPQTFTRETLVLPCEDPGTGIRVDFIFSFTPYELQAIERAQKVKMGTAEVNFASKEDLVIHKIFSGRARDLEDVKSVLLKNPDLDLDYVRDWLTKFSDSLEEPFISLLDSVLEALN